MTETINRANPTETISPLDPQLAGDSFQDALFDVNPDTLFDIDPDTLAVTEPVVGSENAVNLLDSQTEQAKKVDAEARYDDAMLLGRSYRVRRVVQEGGTQSIKMWQGAKAKMRNALDMPGKIVRQFAHARAKTSHEHKESRLRKATSTRLIEIRQISVNESQVRLDHRSTSLEERTSRMEHRTKSVHENALQRRQSYTEELKKRRGKSLADKAVRRQLRQEGASRREVKTAMVNLPAEHMANVAKVAIVAEASKRELKAADGSVIKKGTRQERTERTISNEDTRIGQYDTRAKEAKKNAEDIRDRILPHAQRSLQELRNKLESTAVDDPDYSVIVESVQSAKRVVDSQASSLRYWNEAEVDNQRKESEARSRLTDLQQLHITQKGRVASASEKADDINVKHKKDRANLNDEVSVILNANKQKVKK